MKTVVIGAGITGLVTAIRLRQAGQDVTLVTKGIGGLQLGQGTLDVFGYSPDRVDNPIAEVDKVAASDPTHPYAAIGSDNVRKGLEYTAGLLDGLVEGDPEKNVLLPTAVGAMRPTAYIQPSMANGVITADSKFLIAGPRQLKDFYPQLIAGNLARTDLPGGGRIQARPGSFSIPARGTEADSSGLNYARALDRPEYRKEFAAQIKPLAKEGETVGLPAMLGLRDRNAWRDLQDLIGAPIFEIPLPPPGVPGMRLNEHLTDLAKELRVKIILGSPVVSGTEENGRVVSVTVASTGHDMVIKADNVVLCTGGFESGSLELDSYGIMSETIFGLPLVGNEIPEPTHGQYWGDPQPMFRVGVKVGEDMRVLDASGQPVYDNLYAAGGILAGSIRWTEKNGEGVAVGSAYAATEAILGGNS